MTKKIVPYGYTKAGKIRKHKVTKATLGRPTAYNEDLAVEICSLIAQGKSVKRTAETVGVSTVTIYTWIRDIEEFLNMYERAKEDQADLLAEEIVDISDNATNDWMMTNDPDNPGYRLNGENIQRSRLRVDARKWTAARLKPRKYGDNARLQAEVKNTTGSTSWLSDTLIDIDKNK